MGISAERFTGYFSTNASKRAASLGEKSVIVSGLIASTPLPTLPLPSPSLPRPSCCAIVLSPSTPTLPGFHLHASRLWRRPSAPNAAASTRGLQQSSYYPL